MPTVTETRLLKINAEKNQKRFYSMEILPNLFGEWTLCRNWGRIGTKGQQKLSCYQSKKEAEKALLAVENAKRKKGYIVEAYQLLFSF